MTTSHVNTFPDVLLTALTDTPLAALTDMLLVA
jgi:hypothetical protein